jgi:hypothetical protein
MTKKSSKKSPFQSIFDSYLDELFDLARRGDAREESHYPALNNLLNALARAQGARHRGHRAAQADRSRQP